MKVKLSPIAKTNCSRQNQNWWLEDFGQQSSKYVMDHYTINMKWIFFFLVSCLYLKPCFPQIVDLPLTIWTIFAVFVEKACLAPAHFYNHLSWG